MALSALFADTLSTNAKPFQHTNYFPPSFDKGLSNQPLKGKVEVARAMVTI